jgi:hypothetical protein
MTLTTVSRGIDVTQVNPNDVATAAIQVLLGAIARLDALKRQPQADVVQLDTQIDALQAQQAALRDQALRQIEDSPAGQQAIAAMSAAAATLAAEATTLKATATDLTGVAQLVTAATSLVAAFAPFL